MDMFLVSI